MKHFLTFLSCIAILVLASTTHATTEDKTPSEVVEWYCALDYGGARLSSDTYEPVAKLMSWYETGEGGEPGWDSCYVVSGYRIMREINYGKTAIVEVEYDLAAIDDVPDLIILGITTIDRILLVKVNEEWRVRWPVNHPRVSVDAAIRADESLLPSYLKHEDKSESEGLKRNIYLLKMVRQDLKEGTPPSRLLYKFPRLLKE